MDTENAWHALDVEEVLEKLDTGMMGLTSVESQRRLGIHGANELVEEERVSKLDLLLHQLRNPLVAVLGLAALISVAAGKMVDTVVIAGVIVLNTLIGFSQEYRAEEALRALKTMAAPEAEVIRDGVEVDITTREIVPGDVILLETGDRVPADVRVFEAINLEMDESMLTGESTPVRKAIETLEKELSVADRVNMAFAGTIVTQGRGRAVVVSTGMGTEMGKIANLIKETEEVQTPIQMRTMDLSRKLGLLALLASGLTFSIAIVRGFELYEVFLFSLASAVSSIPEGLPAVMTITLAVAVDRMAKRNAIVRKIQAVDTLGSATTIVTDKTGTLTTNQMTVRKIFVADKMVEVTGAGFSAEGHFEVGGKPVDPKGDESLLLTLYIAALCNDARITRSEVRADRRWDIRGDPTESALLLAAQKAGLEKDSLEEKMPRVDEIPFNPTDRYMATFHGDSTTNLKVFVKGAPRVILDMCSEVLENGAVKELTPGKREEIFETNTRMAGEALRVLAMAYQTVGTEDVSDFKGRMRDRQAKLVFVGLVGMIDPPRPEAKNAVQLCRRAGIRVIMATGDHRLTAEAIAKEVGIFDPGSKILKGVDLDNMGDGELDAVMEETSVFARSSPIHKHRIVESLRRKGHVVAVTGDGINDAPALKAAEIGVSMGITGTDVTKETADMVLTDDNFASIVSAVEEGRVVFENIRKVVKYLIATNIGEDIAILASLLLLRDAPLIFTPVQILWVNLVTDGLLDITLAMEPKEEDVMDEPPRRPNEKIINREIFLNTIYVSLFMAVGTLWVFSTEWNHGDILRAQTIGFTTMAMFQVFNSLNCRSRTRSIFRLGLFTNKYLIAAIAASVLLQVSATVLPVLQLALGTTPLSVQDWLTIVVVSSSVFVADELRKLTRSRARGDPR